MNKYAVAVLLNFDNENKIFIIEAENEISAIKQAIIKYSKDDIDTTNWINATNITNVDELLENLYDADYIVSKPIQLC